MMRTTITDQQMQDLAQSYSRAASAIALIRSASLKAGVPLKDPTMILLQSKIFSLTNIYSQIALADANLVLEDADKSVAAITVATTKANLALEKLKDVNKAINIGAALIVLAAGVATGDAGQMAEYAKDVFDAASA